MATATAPAPAGKKYATLDEIRLFLGEDVKTLPEVLERVEQSALAKAWASGEVEFGHTKYCMSGNPESPKSEPTLIIEGDGTEGGIEWGGAKTVRHGRLAHILAEKLPVFERYQRYRKEMLVNREKDVWEWVDDPRQIMGRETRLARYPSSREEAEQTFTRYVRLTDKGLSAIQG